MEQTFNETSGASNRAELAQQDAQRREQNASSGAQQQQGGSAGREAIANKDPSGESLATRLRQSIASLRMFG